MIGRVTPWNSNTAVAPKCRIDDLAEMQAVRYKSTDGLEIPAYLTLPKGVESKKPARHCHAPRWPLGTRLLGLQLLPSIPR
jgi:dipeptidyl aminopeptidase/acylaminoacyl peptidase